MEQDKQIELPLVIAGFCIGAKGAECTAYRGRGRPRKLRLWEICVRPDLLECGWPLSAREIDKPYSSGVFCDTGRGIRDTHPDETAEGGKGFCNERTAQICGYCGLLGEPDLPLDHWEVCKDFPF